MSGKRLKYFFVTLDHQADKCRVTFFCDAKKSNPTYMTLASKETKKIRKPDCAEYNNDQPDSDVLINRE